MDLTFSQEIISSKIDILSKRRDYLLKQRDRLQTYIDEADKVIQVATSWMREENGGNRFTFTDINRIAEEKLVQLCATELSAACEKQKLRSATPQHRSARHGQASVACDDFQKMATEIKEMQDSISSLRTDTENISEKQSSTDKHIDSLSDNYLTTQQQRMTEVEEKLKILTETQKGTVEQQNKRIKSLEDELKHVADEQSNIVERYSQQQDKIKEQKVKSEKQSKRLTKSLENIEELSIRVLFLENNNLLINTQLEGLENKVNCVETSLEDLTVKFEECGSSLEDFTKRSDDALKSLASDSKSILDKVQKCEDKAADLEVDLGETSLKNEKLFNKNKIEFNMLCISTTERLAPLEKLRNIFNTKLALRTQNTRRLDTVCDQMNVLLAHLDKYVPSSVVENLLANSRSVPTEETKKQQQKNPAPTFEKLKQKLMASPSASIIWKPFGTSAPGTSALGTSASAFGTAALVTSASTLVTSAFGTSTSVPTLGTSASTLGTSASTLGTLALVTSTPALVTSAFGTSTLGTSALTFGTSALTLDTSASIYGRLSPTEILSSPTYSPTSPSYLPT